jgi:NAD(P)-dependent dehydrogenase (short-subunit alcohol dehydrogenase family)
MLLSNRVVIITGGARGIGKGIALKFADEGCSIIIADVLVEEARKTLEEISEKGREAIFVQCDVSNSRQVQDVVDQTISRFGKIDILVNNAGISGAIKSIVDVSEEEWDRLLAINLKGVFLCCKAVVPYMKKKGYGKIINISSSAAVAPPAPLIHYSSSKAGVLGLTRDLALELAPLNICVNAILPGLIPTDMWDNLQVFPPGVKKEDVFAEMGKMFAPMQRVGTPEDIAGAALFLASDLSAYVTGDRIIVGGGYPLKQFFK